jgi:hypothetical protein
VVFVGRQRGSWNSQARAFADPGFFLEWTPKGKASPGWVRLFLLPKFRISDGAGKTAKYVGVERVWNEARHGSNGAKKLDSFSGNHLSVSGCTGKG